MSRFAKTNIVIGATGTGKTSLVEDTIEGQSAIFYTGSKRDPAVSALPDAPLDNLSQIVGDGKFYRLITYDHGKALRAIVDDYVNGNIVFDDIKSIMASNVGKMFTQIIGSVRHNANDLFFLFWHVNDVPPFLYQMASTVTIFKQGDIELNSDMKKFPRLEEYERAMKWIQEADPVIHKHSFAFMVTDPTDPRSKEPFRKCERTKPIAL